MAGSPERMTFSESQVALLREVLRGALPPVVEAGERMAHGQVVERSEADAVVDALSTAFIAEDQEPGGPTPRGRLIDDLIGVAQQMSRDFYE